MANVKSTSSINRQFIAWFEEIDLQDLPRVGGKNASLGELYTELSGLGINVPNGFAVTAQAFEHFMKVKCSLMKSKSVKDHTVNSRG